MHIFRFIITPTLIIVTLIFLACNDNSVNVSNQSKTITGFYGILHNYDSAENIIDTRIFLDSGFVSMGKDTVGTDSLLNLILLTPDVSILKPISEIASGYGGNLIVSDANAKGTDYLKIFFFNRNIGQVYGTLQRSNTPANPAYYAGLYEVNFAYCDRSANITGTVVNIWSIFGPDDTLKYNVNINLSRGWNPITYYTRIARAYYYEYDVYTDDPDGAKWYYLHFNSEEQNKRDNFISQIDKKFFRSNLFK